MYEDILLSVSRPSRYIGGEINSVKKDLSKVRTKVALVFPDVYEVGMSHLGLKILYHIINNMEDAAAERAFVPWVDLEEVLMKRGLPLVSMESSLPLREFDIIGFTLPYELCYTNILTTLSLSGIPLYSSERDERHPLIIGGGTAVFNPEPMAEFFDAFFLGDGEEGIGDIIRVYSTWKGSGRSRESLLLELSGIVGIYIPSFYHIEYNENGTVHSILPRKGVAGKVKRRILEDLDRAPYPVSPPLPYMQTVHDRLTVEIARGCTHGCRFCQAGITYRPVRERSPERILDLIEHSLRETGYEEVSLVSLSTGDFACLNNLLTSLNEKYRDDYISFSLPSLRIGTLTPRIIEEVTASKNSSFTIAPEAGTERLRKVINKEMDVGIFETTVEDLFRKGCKSLKMYFMIGLPTEEESDLEGIVGLAKRAKDIGKRSGKGGRDITVSVSTFVPKPHTPFQWYGQIDREEIERKIDYLKSGLKRLNISFKWHSWEMSHLEAVFSRGDRRLGKVIEAAWRAGCRFDSWTERLDLRKWEEAFHRCGIDPDFYATREIPIEEILPWDHLDTGVSKEFLVKEYQRAIKGRVIPDCRYGACPNCGVCDMEAVRGRKDGGVRPITRRSDIDSSFTFNSRDTGTGLSFHPSEEQKKGAKRILPRSSIPHVTYKLRVRYSKTGRMRMLSQLEVMTTFSRALRRASIPINFTEGFHPHPKISFGPALPVGMESVCEYMDVELTRPLAPFKFKEGVNRCLPEGLEVVSVKEVPRNIPSLNSFITLFAYEIDFDEEMMQHREERGNEEPRDKNVPSIDRGDRVVTLDDSRGFPTPIELLSDSGELWVRRVVEKDGKKVLREINTRPFIEDIHWTGRGTLFLLLKSQKGECCRPSDVVCALFGVAPDDPGLRIRRVGLYGEIEGIMVSPEDGARKSMMAL